MRQCEWVIIIVADQNELMGLVKGEYDAKKQGITPGGISIHNCMTAHGPDAASYEQASTAELKPEYYGNTLAFMFETCEPWQITAKAYAHETRQRDYVKCWQGLEPKFKAQNLK